MFFAVLVIAAKVYAAATDLLTTAAGQVHYLALWQVLYYHCAPTLRLRSACCMLSYTTRS